MKTAIPDTPRQDPQIGISDHRQAKQSPLKTTVIEDDEDGRRKRIRRRQADNDVTHEQRRPRGRRYQEHRHKQVRRQ